MMVGNVFFERWSSFVLAALCLYGDDLCAVLDEEINLTVFVRVVTRLHLKLTAELLQNVVLRQWPFELKVRFQQNCAVINTSHVLEQTRIKHKQLELIQLIKGC